MRSADDADLAAIRAGLGREPRGRFEVVVRDDAGAPIVIRNAPLLDDGTPMPTLYWLIGPAEQVAVSRLEADGGVRAAASAVDPAAVADAHRRYAAERDADVPPDAPHRPDGGVGGTREGVKCLHAHYAWHLAGGVDPVGQWVAARLAARLDVAVGDTVTTFSHAGHDVRVPVGPVSLLAGVLADPDPPAPEQLTNALGTVSDHLDDVIRERPDVIDAHDVRLSGAEPWHFARVEHGGPPRHETVRVAREDAEDVFRTLATERRADRLHNPGLEPSRVDSVLATSCIVLTVMRRLHLDHVSISLAAGVGGGG